MKNLASSTAFYVGARKSDGRYPYNGDIFALRAYSANLTDAQAAYNYKIDRNRFHLPKKTFTWNGADGYFATNGNWSVGLAATGVPGAEDIAVIPAGNDTVTLDDEWVVDTLTIGRARRSRSRCRRTATPPTSCRSPCWAASRRTLARGSRSKPGRSTGIIKTRKRRR